MASALTASGKLPSSRKRTEIRKRWLAMAERMDADATAKTPGTAQEENWRLAVARKVCVEPGSQTPAECDRASVSGILIMQAMLRTTPIRLLGLALVVLGAGGVIWFTASTGANTMAKADE